MPHTKINNKNIHNITKAIENHKAKKVQFLLNTKINLTDGFFFIYLTNSFTS